MAGETLLDQPARYPEIDKQGGADLIRNLPDQLDEGRLLADAAPPPPPSRGVAIFGLGGSGVVGKVVEAVMGGRSPVPVVVVRDFRAPAWVGKDTLPVFVSYSGNTIETLTAAKDVVARGGRPFFISSGGKLLEMARAGAFPYAQVPAGRPPRCSLGYMAAALFAYLAKGDGWQGFDAGAVAAHLRGVWKRWGYDVPMAENDAKRLALSLRDAPYATVYGAGPLSAVAAERCRAQLAENAKYFASSHSFPELCHNELVAFEEPNDAVKSLRIIVFRPAAETPDERTQTDVAIELMASKAAAISQYRAAAEGAAGLFEQIYFGDVVSYYLSLLRGVDAVPVPSIVTLKKRVSG